MLHKQDRKKVAKNHKTREKAKSHNFEAHWLLRQTPTRCIGQIQSIDGSNLKGARLNGRSRSRLGSGLRKILQFGSGRRLLRDSLLNVGDDSLQLFKTTILLLDFAAESLNFVVQIDSVLISLRHVSEISDGRRVVATLHSSNRERGGTDALNTIKFGGAVPRHINHGGSFVIVHVATAKMFAQIFLARKSVASAAVAIRVWAHQGLLSVGIFLVHFALVTKETTRVGETLDLVAVWFITLVGTIMFIHMFAKVMLVLGALKRQR